MVIALMNEILEYRVIDIVIREMSLGRFVWRRGG